MPYLYEKIDGIRDAGYAQEMPSYIPSNLNQAFELRPYQVAAFENFITYFENEKLPESYTFKDTVPVGISNGECKIDFSRILTKMEKIGDQ